MREAWEPSKKRCHVRNEGAFCGISIFGETLNG